MVGLLLFVVLLVIVGMFWEHVAGVLLVLVLVVGGLGLWAYSASQESKEAGARKEASAEAEEALVRDALTTYIASVRLSNIEWFSTDFPNSQTGDMESSATGVWSTDGTYVVGAVKGFGPFLRSRDLPNELQRYGDIGFKRGDGIQISFDSWEDAWVPIDVSAEGWLMFNDHGLSEEAFFRQLRLGDSLLVQLTDRAGRRRVALPLNGASAALDYIGVR